MSEMSINNLNDNDVNGAGTSCESSTSGRCSTETQREPDRQQTTAKLKWTKEVNKIVMRCFYKSDPSKRGYRKRMIAIWNDIGVFEITEQRLADQNRMIRTNGWLSNVELDEIHRELIEDVQEQDDRGVTGADNTAEDLREQLFQEENIVDDELNIENIMGIRQTELNEDQIKLIEEVLEQMKLNETPPNLRNIERKIINAKVDEVNEVLEYIPTNNISSTNQLLKA